MSAGPSDPGIANERTALAWQRTALSIVAGSAILARLRFAEAGAVALVPPGFSMLLGLWIVAESRGRYAHDAGVRLRRRSRGGRAPACLCAATVLLALTELIWLLDH
jgi:uncharacterized membrane protein YidH (DUF202 family)